MKTLHIYFLITILFIQSISSIQAQTTEGREFWITFGQILAYPMSPTSVHLFDMQIRIVSGNEATSGTIFFTDLGNSHSFNILPYEVYTYVLQDEEKYAVYNTISNNVTHKSIRINTLHSVSVYVSTKFDARCDVTNVLPVTALGTEYYAISYRVFTINNDAYGVVATQNNTQLYHNGVPVATLNAGQVYYRTSVSLNGITGDFITANKPVAFFALCRSTSVPDGISNILFQQLAPINTWGKTFFVPVTILGHERVRIVASENNTNITQTGGAIMTDTGGQPTLNNLQAGQFVELDLTTGNTGCFLNTNNPVGVCSFMRSRGTINPLGGCSQAWIPGIEQTTPKILLAPFAYSIYSSHYAIIYTSTATKDSTKVSIGGGTPVSLSGGIWINNAASGMSFYNFQLTDLSASYVFSNPQGTIVLGYALGGSSYYYLAGSAMRSLLAGFYANNIFYQNFQDATIYCGFDVHFRAEVEGLHPASNRLRWYVNGVERTAYRDQETWSENLPVGEYEIAMWVRYENNTETTITSTLKIQERWVKMRNVKK